MTASTLGYTPGSGAQVATDQDGNGAHHQKAVMEYVADNGVTPVTENTPLPTEDKNSGNLLLRILQMLMSPLGYDKSLQRQRGTVVVETLPTLAAVTTVTTVTTVANITSLNNIDTYNARVQVLDNNRAAWAQCVRSRIT